MSIENEPDVIEKAKAGDPEAVTHLVNEYADIIYRFAFNVCRNPDKAEHTTQETFVSLLRKLDQFDSRSKFSTWLYTIVSNHCLMLARGTKADRFVSIDDGDEDTPDVLLGAGGETPLDEAERSDTKMHLDRAIQKLGAEYKVVFILRDIEGLSTEEVAGILNLSVPAVKSRLHRARSFLRKELSSLFAEDYHGKD
ncbi:MAG: RNA polymerase sigma factor [Ignavibacteria bacterium]|nr:RNA polymerase sigma factor [Ignavibacteria bacterium]